MKGIVAQMDESQQSRLFTITLFIDAKPEMARAILDQIENKFSGRPEVNDIQLIEVSKGLGRFGGVLSATTQPIEKERPTICPACGTSDDCFTQKDDSKHCDNCGKDFK